MLGDVEQLIQVLHNIVENALHALTESPGGAAAGRVRIEAAQKDGEPIDAKRWIQLDVIDNGPGIAGEFQKRIFDPFVSSRATGQRLGGGGTGLGLAIVSKLIERHHGQIKLMSKPGEGSCFRILLPCA